MEYRAKDNFESLTRPLINGLMWIGVIGIFWNLFKPGGWLLWIIDVIMHNQPYSLYYISVGVLGVIAAKVWLDTVDPAAFYSLLTAAWAFAGTFFILSLLLPL
jgi:hypothetical protein